MSIAKETHEAIVTVNEDEEKRGRIQVHCPALIPSVEGEPPVTLPHWIDPVHDWGWFYIPDVGETVEIEISVSADDDDSFGQLSLENMDPRWRGKRYATNAELDDDSDGEIPRPIHDDLISKNYGKRRGFATPHGHTFVFDDTEGDPSVALTFSKDPLQPGEAPTPENTSRVEFEPDGSLKITLLNKHTIHLQTEGNALQVALDEAKHTLTLDAENKAFKVALDEEKFTAELDGTQFKIGLDGATLKVEGKDGDAKQTIGDGAVSAAIAEHLKTYIDDTVKAEFDAHTHPDAMGGTGAPLVPLTGYDDAITSSKNKFPDG